jgi:hypothetical protein
VAESVQLLGLAGRVAAVLLVCSSCIAANAVEPSAAAPGAAASRTLTLAERSPAPQHPVLAGTAPVSLDGPTLVDTDGARMSDEHAEVVRTVHRALTAGDLGALAELYAGDDWAGQAELLASARVRRGVLDALRTNPANLGEGYVYPGFAADSTMPYSGYRTAFFLDYDPPQLTGGPLRWRGIAPPGPALIG